MRQRSVLAAGVFACVALMVPGYAQEGHPLTGTWAGDWGPTATDRRHLTIVMSWDGKTVSGIINPGPDAVPIGSVFLNLPDWTVRIDADATGPSGPVHISAEGRLDEIGSPHRRIAGSWRQGTTNGDFKLARE